MKKYERVKALVSLDAIAHNFEEMTISGDLQQLLQRRHWSSGMQGSPSLS